MHTRKMDLTALVVDDSRTVRELLVAMLDAHGVTRVVRRPKTASARSAHWKSPTSRSDRPANGIVPGSIWAWRSTCPRWRSVGSTCPTSSKTGSPAPASRTTASRWSWPRVRSWARPRSCTSCRASVCAGSNCRSTLRHRALEPAAPQASAVHRTQDRPHLRQRRGWRRRSALHPRNQHRPGPAPAHGGRRRRRRELGRLETARRPGLRCRPGLRRRTAGRCRRHCAVRAALERATPLRRGGPTRPDPRVC